jgi:hypothetical protein
VDSKRWYEDNAWDPRIGEQGSLPTPFDKGLNGSNLKGKCPPIGPLDYWINGIPFAEAGPVAYPACCSPAPFVQGEAGVEITASVYWTQREIIAGAAGVLITAAVAWQQRFHQVGQAGLVVTAAGSMSVAGLIAGSASLVVTSSTSQHGGHQVLGSASLVVTSSTTQHLGDQLHGSASLDVS